MTEYIAHCASCEELAGMVHEEGGKRHETNPNSNREARSFRWGLTYMAPFPDMTPAEQANLEQKIDHLKLHRS